jgi:recombination protein U
MNDDLGKKAEKKIKEWLDRKEDGYSFDRIPDQLSGFYGSSNICDFQCYKCPYQYYIESKATWHDRFEFNKITDKQLNEVADKSFIEGVFGLCIVLFAAHQRAFIFNMQDIRSCIENNITKSLNIKKIDKWPIKFAEIKTILSRKELLDYTGELDDYVKSFNEV